MTTLTIASLLQSSLAWSAVSSKDMDAHSAKGISLNEALAQSLRDNHDQKLRDYSGSILELQWKDSRDNYWFPKIELSLGVQEHRVSRLRPGTNNRGARDTAPEGVVSLDFGEYNVFNWGKDYLDYLNKRERFLRDKQSLVEGKRHLKQEVVLLYFNLLTKKQIEMTLRDQLRNASFVYRLNRHRVQIRKITRQEYYESRSEFLRSQQEYYQARQELDVAMEQLAYLLNDPQGTRYILREKLRFLKSEVSLDDAMQFARNNNPDILESKTLYDLAERSHEIARRENLPLPKFSVDLGAYSQNYGKSTLNQEYESGSGTSNIEIVATLNATWTVFGENGFMNQRSLQQSFLRRGSSARNVAKQKDLAESLVKRTFTNVQTLQKQYIIGESRYNNARKHYNTTLDNYTRSKTTFVNFHHALRELKEAEVALSQIKYDHLKEKILLARYSGMESFPGERHEELAEKMANVEEIEDQNESVQVDGDIPASAGSDGAAPPEPKEEAAAPSEPAAEEDNSSTQPAEATTETSSESNADSGLPTDTESSSEPSGDAPAETQEESATPAPSDAGGDTSGAPEETP